MRHTIASATALFLLVCLLAGCATTPTAPPELRAQFSGRMLPEHGPARNAFAHDDELMIQLEKKAKASGKDEFEEYCRLLEQALSRKQFHLAAEFLVTKGPQRALVAEGWKRP